MTNVIRTLVWGQEVSLTIIDGTKLCQEGEKVHALTGISNEVFAKSLLFTAFLSACLKNEKGGVSLSIRGKGISDVTVSGNKRLEIRGAIDVQAEEKISLDALTVIRDDGYSRPFVGACAAVAGDMDAQFEEYFRLSEQLPTFFKSDVVFDDDGNITFAGMVILQPLPFASEENLRRAEDRELLDFAVQTLKEKGLKECAKELFSASETDLEEKTVKYQCNCSREYLSGVLMSVGKDELLKIIEEEGCVKIHCHYCNTDYEFNVVDVEKLFENK